MSGLVLADRLPGGPLGRPRAAAPSPRAASRLAGPASVVAGSASLQAAAAMATTLFVAYGAAGTSALRFTAGAVVLLALARPRVRGRTWRSWAWIAAFGATMAAANFFLFETIARTSLGTAVTLQFLGPLALALLAARRRLDLVCAVAGAAGVVLLTGGPSGASVAGMALGLGAAACVAISALVGERVARDTAGLEGLALAVAAAALLTAPVGVPAAAGALDLGELATLAGVGVLGIAIVVTASAAPTGTSGRGR